MGKPLITKETVPKAKLDDWLDELWFVYAGVDLHRNLHQVWSMAYEDATKVGEAIRENKPENCLKYLAHTFCWIASFVAKLDRDPMVAKRFKHPNFKYTLSNVTWFKYDGRCPKCHKAGCLCPLLPPELIAREIKASGSEESGKAVKDRPVTMDGWGGMFANIYDQAHFIKSLDELGFHLLEEMGEVEEVIRRIATWTEWKKKHLGEKDLLELQEDLIREVADTVSWCFSIVRKIARECESYQKLEESYARKRGHTFITPGLTLSKVLWNEYRRERRNEIGCPVCKKRRCILGVKEVEWILTEQDSYNGVSTL